MMSARMSTLASLRGDIERLEAHGDGYAPNKVALGHAGADATLRGAIANDDKNERAGKFPRLHDATRNT